MPPLPPCQKRTAAMALDNLTQRLQQLQLDIDDYLDERRKNFHYTVERRKVAFEQHVREQHRQFRLSSFTFLVRSGFFSLLFSPLVYALILPLAFLDLCVSFFQWVCFPVYGIEKVKRADFISMDRHKLAYLNWIEKLNCVYCGYANGLLAYTRAIAGRAEEHWCPIKHARRLHGRQDEYWSFADYGDVQDWRRKSDAVYKVHLNRVAETWIKEEEDKKTDDGNEGDGGTNNRS